MLQDIWNYRGFILGSVTRDFQLKYRNSLLGAVWSVLTPLAMILVYTVIFSGVMKAQLPGVDNPFAYSIYLCAGILTWGLFSEIVSRSQTVFLENANLLKKVSFPRICLPVAVVLNALLNFVIAFGLFTGFLILTGNFPGLSYLALIPLLILQIFFSISLGVVVGILNVFFRDAGQLMAIVLQFWFWLTPIVYSRSILGESAQHFIAFNPLADLVAAYQGILVLNQFPDWISLTPLLLLSVALFMVSMRLFRRRASEMVDEL
ncbi:ABC transporter permease [Polynucleobacter asymbioticus]|nr:ABC transporter permease [Polynucleobacter asymbioticus]